MGEAIKEKIARSNIAISIQACPCIWEIAWILFWG